MSVTRAKQQVVVIHGGDSFATQKRYIRSLKKWPVTLKKFLPKSGWKSSLPKELGQKFQVLMPQMPNKSNARYAEWKIWFERMYPYTKTNVILVGHSLGAIFLAKYLATTKFPKKITAVILVAAPHNHTADIGDFYLPRSLHQLSQQASQIIFFHSPNDRVVAISELAAYGRLLPTAKQVIIKNRGHFSNDRFPELVRLIKKLSAR